MSNLEDYKAKLEIITAIKDENIKIPAIPVHVFVQEAERNGHYS